MNVYVRICTFGLLSVVLLVAASVQSSKIHERMTDDEIANVFHTTRDKVPEYDVVPVRHNRYKRLSQNLRLQFSAFGEKVDAYLHPSDGRLMGADTPVWLAYTTPQGKVEYKKLQNGIVGTVVSSFVNPKDFSSIAVHQPRGKRASFNGVFNAYQLRSLPKRFQDEERFKRNSEAFNASRTMLDTHYHVIIKSKSLAEEEEIRRLQGQIRKTSQSGNRADSSRVKRSDQDIIYPSLLVQTDYKGSMTTQNYLDHFEEILYQVAYWNAVDMRYRHVDTPKIRLRIVGLIIGADRAATPFLHHHRSGDVISMAGASDEANEYWYKMGQQKDFPHKAYDIAMTITDSDLSYQGNMLQGLAATSSSCMRPRQNIFYAIGIVRDKGGFDGILAATHELGHILGLYHDSESGNECSNGFIMAPRTKISLNNMKWSPCSLRALSYFLRKPNINCYDRPEEFHPPGDQVQQLLPGDVKDSHAQCRARGYAEACDSNPNMCTIMECTNGSGCTTVGPAAEGTRCAPGHKCLDGVCQCMSTDCIYVNS